MLYQIWAAKQEIQRTNTGASVWPPPTHQVLERRFSLFVYKIQARPSDKNHTTVPGPPSPLD